MLQKLKRHARRVYNSIFLRSNAAIFDDIYRRRLWSIGDDPTAEFYSGIGSYDPSIAEYVDLVKCLIKQLGMKSVIEIGCGDFAVASQYVGVCQTYTGIEVVKRLAERNKRTFGSDTVKFLWLDASKSKLPSSDFCIIRQVLQHLNNKDIAAIFENVSSKHILVTEHLPAAANITSYNADKKAGGGIRVPGGSGVFIDKPPFNQTAEVILEKNVTSDIHSPDERLVTWLISRP